MEPQDGVKKRTASDEARGVNDLERGLGLVGTELLADQRCAGDTDAEVARKGQALKDLEADAEARFDFRGERLEDQAEDEEVDAGEDQNRTGDRKGDLGDGEYARELGSPAAKETHPETELQNQ